MANAITKRVYIFEDKRLDDFITYLAQSNNPHEAAQLAGIELIELMQIRKENKEFEYWYNEAKKIGFMAWEAEAYRRAVVGVEEPIYYKGEKVGVKFNYSDGLLQFLLAAEDPEKYGRQKIDVTSKVDVAEKLAAARKRVGAEPELLTGAKK